MATGRQIREAISRSTGVPERTLIHVERRLGEAGLLPRGPRGRNAPHLKSLHTVRFLIGAMSIGDGVQSSAARVVQQVRKISAFASFEIVRVAQVSGNAWKPELGVDGNPTTMVAPKGRFDRALEFILDELIQSDQYHALHVESAIRSIGIEWQRDFVVSWIAPEGEFVGSLATEPGRLGKRPHDRIYFFDRRNAKKHDELIFFKPAGMVREAYIGSSCLWQIAEVMRDSHA